MRNLSNNAILSLQGLAVGDAWGGVLEFMHRAPTLKEIEAARLLPGGGPHRLAPGQVTDDCELALACSWAIANHAPIGTGFDAASADLEKWYKIWLDSSPFDIGGTCRAGFGGGAKNTGSKANGALMRVAPIAAWLHEEPVAAQAMAVRDAEISHPNRTCLAANESFVVGLNALLGGKTPLEAWEEVRTWVRRHASQELIDWTADVDAGLEFDALHQCGYVGHAWRLAFMSLLDAKSFEEGIEFVLEAGGDTDTNAAIAGALLGAAGMAPPDDMIDTVMGCDTRQGRARPALFHPARFKTLAVL